MHQNVSEMISKHHFEAKNDHKTTKIHFLEPKMIKICSPKSKIKTSDLDPEEGVRDPEVKDFSRIYWRKFNFSRGPPGILKLY